MKILVVGYGSIGKRHINNLSSVPGIEILICTNRKNNRFLKQKGRLVFNSITDAINAKPDAALITNVTRLHVQTAIKLANAKIDLFIEKPLSDSLRDVVKLMRIIRKHNIITFMGCNLRFHPCIKMIRKIIHEKEIGRIISVRVENGSFLPCWHPHGDYRKSYAAREDMGGGALLTCIHEIDYLYWFFGKPIEIFSFTGKFSDLAISADDLSSILLKFKTNIVAEIHLDYFQRPSIRSCKIIGTKGTIYWDTDSDTVKMYDVKKRRWIIKLRQKNYDYNLTYLEEMNHFLNSIKRKKKPINDIRQGMDVLQIALAAKKASKIKKVVQFI